MKKNIVPCTGFEPWSLHLAIHSEGLRRFRADLLAMSHAGWMDYAICLSATERRTTTAKRDDLHSKSLFLVKNKGQWNAKSGPKAAYGNFAMRTKFSGRMDSK